MALETRTWQRRTVTLTPLIDIIFLLLIFFILTTKFIAHEKVISNLLPTDKGQALTTPPVVEPPPDINVCIYPDGMTQQMQPSELEAAWKDGYPENTQEAVFRIGREGQIVVDGKALGSESKAVAEPAVAAIHDYVRDRLARVEAGGSRKDQPPVVIHCFSGMPWKYALVAYDAVRASEAARSGQTGSMSQEQLENAREVNFAPPRIRNFHTWQFGYELSDILALP